MLIRRQFSLFSFALVFILFSFSLVFGAFSANNADVQFVDGTPANGTTQTDPTLNINLSVNYTNEHYAFIDLDDSVVTWLRMDNRDGSDNPLDDSGNGINGSITGGGADPDTAGRYGDAFRFDLVGDRISIADQDAIDIPVGTYSLWFNVSEANNLETLVYRNRNLAGNFDGDFRLWFTSGGLRARLENETDTANLASDVVNLQTWNHVVTTYNGTTLSLYLNGTLQAATDINVTTFGYPVGALWLGNSLDVTDRNIHGLIDEFILFNRSLSAAEVLALYNASQYRYDVNFENYSIGTHTVRGYVVNGSDGGMTDLRTFTLGEEFDPPVVAIHSPSSLENSTEVFINISATDASGVDQLWFSFNGTNVTYTDVVYRNYSVGSQNITAYANDSRGIVGNTTLFFTVDTLNITLVNFSIAAPAPNESIILNATINSYIAGGSCNLTGDLGGNSSSIGVGENLELIFNMGLKDKGIHEYNLTCNNGEEQESVVGSIEVVDFVNVLPTTLDISKQGPVEGEVIVLSANIKSENRDASNVGVHFYEDGNLIGNLSVSSILADTVQGVFIEHSFDTGGLKVVKVVVDENDTIQEDSLDNSRTLVVAVGVEGASGGINVSASIESDPTGQYGAFNVSGVASYNFSEDIKVSGANVVLSFEGDGTTSTEAFQTTTDSSGSFNFTDIFADRDLGTYDLNISVSDSTISGIWTGNLTVESSSSSLPDFVGKSLTFTPSWAAANQSFTIVGNIRNFGGVSGNVTSWIVQSGTVLKEQNNTLSSGGSANIVLTHNQSKEGFYTYRVRTDPNSEVVEDHEGNNDVGAAIQVVLSVADLYVSSFRASDHIPVVGDNVQINATILNNGGVTFANTSLMLFEDNLLVTEYLLDGIAPFSGSNITHFNYVPTSAGNFTLKVAINKNQTLEETDYDDNNASLSIHVLGSAYPDLVVSNIASYPALNSTSVYSDQNTTFMVTVSNFGNTNSTKNVNVSLYVNQTFIGNLTFGKILEGASNVSNISFLVGEEYLLARDLLVAAEVNPGRNITEDFYSNNNRSENFTVSVPDVSVQSSNIIFSDSTPGLGEGIDINVVVENDDVNINATNVSVRLNVSSEEIGVVYLNISPSSSEIASFSWPGSSVSGGKVVTASLNLEFKDYEADKTENVATRSFSVVAASGSTSSGGGGGGGGNSDSCLEEKVCEEWGQCIGSSQTRICKYEGLDCGKVGSEFEEERLCFSPTIEEEPEEEISIEPEEEIVVERDLNFLVSILFILLVFIIVWYVLFSTNRKYHIFLRLYHYVRYKFGYYD